MMLRFSDPLKLKTKQVIFEYNPLFDPYTDVQELLKELTLKRRPIQESINDNSPRTNSGAQKSQCHQDLQYLEKKVEEYLPLLYKMRRGPFGISAPRWTSGLNLRWSSALKKDSNVFNLMSSKLYRVDDMDFELGMTLFLYGAILRERASAILTTDLVEAATLFRKASGVYNYLAYELLPLTNLASYQEIPPEVTPALSAIMSLICLAEAQAVTIRKAEEKGSTSGLLAKLHYGIKILLDNAINTLRLSKIRKTITPRLEEFIYYCGALHELRSQKYMAEGYKENQLGLSVGILRRALPKTKEKLMPTTDESWRVVFRKELDDLREMLRKLEHVHGFVWHDKVPTWDQLPPHEGKQLVNAIQYTLERSEF